MIVPAILFASLLRLSELVSLGEDAMPGVAEVDDDGNGDQPRGDDSHAQPIAHPRA